MSQILVTTKRTKFINPFDPTKVHGELTAFHRRWIHTFPRDRSGLAFQTHHSILRDELEGEGDFDSLSTLSPSGGNLSFRSSTVGSYKGHSWSDDQEFRTLQQVASGRSHRTSMSSSFGDTLVGSVGSRGESAKVTVDAPSKLEIKKEKSLHSDSPKNLKFDSDSPILEPKPDDTSTESHSHKSARAKATPPRGMPAAPWRKMLAHHNMSNPSTKAVEDFTSIRRTGVDWKSLTEPACLPVSVDFFPSKAKLEMDYYESPSKLVVNSFASEVFSSTSSRLVVGVVRWDHLTVM